MTDKFINNVYKDLVFCYGEEEAKKIINGNYMLYEKDPLVSLLKSYNWFMENANNIKDNIDDKHIIYCYLNSSKPARGKATGVRLSYYDDNYLNLQIRGYSFAISDRFSFGKKRERFKLVHQSDIIYPPEGKSFLHDRNLFCAVQAEYIRESINTNQDNAKRLIISKYGIKK